MFGFLRLSEEHPRRGVALRYSMGLPRRGEVEGPERAPPRLRRSVAVLRRGVDTIHTRKFSDFFSEHLVFVHDCLGTLMND